MGNFKVRVNSEAESREIQNILESIGFRKWDAWSESGSIGGFIWTDSDMTYCDNKIEHFNESPREEITLPELRDMVVLKRNDVNDATHESGFFKYVELTDGGYYFEDKWLKSAGAKPEYYTGLREINTGALNTEQHEQPSINDQYAEIEQVRQHRHYFIDVSDVDEIDFYEIALRYNVTDPCIQHILKKCLAVGQRGQKDFHHDLKDIYDTAKRMLAVHGLDS